MPELSPGLRTLLEDAPNAEQAVDTICGDRGLLAECQRVLPLIRQAAAWPATEAEIMEILGRRFALFPQPERSDAEWSAWWSDYFETLNGLTAPALEAGMRAWVRDPDSEFMPKPGALRELAASAIVPMSQAHTRAYRAVQRARLEEDRRPAIFGEPAYVPADRAKVKAMFEGFAGSMRAKQQALEDAKPKPKFPQGKVDAAGITPELRALLARQNAP